MLALVAKERGKLRMQREKLRRIGRDGRVNGDLRNDYVLGRKK
jgi:hypothetical protein